MDIFRNKFLSTFLLAILLVTSSLFAQSTENLVGYWAFDETSGSTASDGSGNGKTGDLQGNAAFAPGKVGNAISLDGTNSWVDIPNFSFAGDFTIAAWVDFTETVNNQDALVGQDVWGQDINFCCPNMRLFTGSGDAIVSNASIPSDTWTHCAITRLGSTLTIYIDGTPDNTSTGFTDPFTPQTIGKGSQGALTAGLIDEVYLYDRCLNDTEIQDLFNASGSSDSEAPSVPAGLSSSDITETSFTLSWTASTDNVGVTGYEVFKDGVSIGTTSSTSMDVTGLTCGTTYAMTVRAQDAVPNWSAQSTASNVATTDCSISFIALNPVADAYVRGGPSGDINYGSDAVLVLKKGLTDDYTRESYIKFDLSSVPGPVSSATLKLYAMTAEAGTSVHTISQVTDDSWTENAITFNNRPTALGGVVSSYNVTSIGEYSIDVTSAVQSEVDGILSLKIESDANLGVSYNSREASQNIPVLEINLSGGEVDTIAPSVPTGLSTSNIAQSSFTLSWTASTDNVAITGYEVFKDGASIGTTSSTSMNVNGLTCNTSYAMTVRAQDAVHNWSAQSSALNETTSVCGNILVGYWAFNETSGSAAVDSSTNGNDGSLKGNASFAPGIVGNAVSLDGTNSWVDIPDQSLAGDFTIAAWVKLSGTVDNNDALVGLETWGQDINFCCPGLRLFTGSGDAITSVSIVNSNTWTHVAITRLGNSLKVYINGVLDNMNSGFTDAFTPQAIGRGALGTSTDGLIDEVYLYQSALDENDIHKLYYSALILNDNEPPTAPDGLAASGITTDGFLLSWNASTDNVGVASYEVSVDGNPIKTTTGTTTIVNGLSCETTFSITVKALDEAGYWSTASSPYNVTTFKCNIDNIDISIDPQQEYQQIRGFGAAIADWLYGHNNDANYIDKIVNDLGLSVMRIFLQTGFEPTNDNSDPNTAGTFNTGNINEQLQVLDKLHQAGLQNVVLSIFSPPAWMKTNGSEIGGSLRTNMYEEFAEFYVEYIKIIEQHGLNVYAISAENEPRWEQSYGSCVYTPEQLLEITKVLGTRMEKEGMSIKIFGPEDVYNQNWTEYTNTMLNDPVANKYTDIVAIHHQQVDLSSAANYTTIRNYIARFHPDDPYALDYWNSEISGYAAGWDGAFNLAKGFMVSLRNAKMNALIYGSPSIPSGLNLDAEALMIDKMPTKRYYTAKQFFKFIRPGSVMVQCTDDISKDVWAVAFKQGEESRLTIVALNNSDEPKAINLDMENLPGQFIQYRSSETEDCMIVDTISGPSVVLSPYSVNTFVAEGTNHLPTIDKVKDLSLVMNENSSKEIAITGISDGDGFTQNLTVTASSSNTALIPDPVIGYNAGETSGTLTLTPVADQIGTSTITLTLQDDGGQDNNGFFSKKQVTFTVQVIAFINIAPTIDAIPDQETYINQGPQSILLSGISDGNSGVQTLMIKEAKSNSTTIKSSKITYVLGESTATYEYTPKSVDTVTVTLYLIDDGDTLLGGKNTKEVNFQINILDNTGVNTSLSDNFKIFPNPAAEYFYIQTGENIEGSVYLELINIGGVTVKKERMAVSEGNIKVPTKNLANGIYFLKITSKEQTWVSKVIVKNE